MPEVTILPDGLQVTAGGGDVLGDEPGCGTGSAAGAAGAGLQGPTVLSAPRRAPSAWVPITNIAISAGGDRLRKVLGFAYPNAAPPPPGRSASNPATRNDRKETMT